MWTDTLRRGGYPRESAALFVELTHHLLRGIYFAETWLPFEVNREEALETWRKIAPIALRSHLNDVPRVKMSDVASALSPRRRGSVLPAGRKKTTQ